MVTDHMEPDSTTMNVMINHHIILFSHGTSQSHLYKRRIQTLYNIVSHFLLTSMPECVSSFCTAGLQPGADGRLYQGSKFVRQQVLLL